MSEQLDIDEGLERAAAELDGLSKALDVADGELSAAEDAWLELFDGVAADLRDEYETKGRRTDPAEHTIVSICRSQHRAEYRRWRDAKRRFDRLQVQSSNRRSELSGWQTRSKNMASEVSVQDQVGQKPERHVGRKTPAPAWTGGRF